MAKTDVEQTQIQKEDAERARLRILIGQAAAIRRTLRKSIYKRGRFQGRAGTRNDRDGQMNGRRRQAEGVTMDNGQMKTSQGLFAVYFFRLSCFYVFFCPGGIPA